MAKPHAKRADRIGIRRSGENARAIVLKRLRAKEPGSAAPLTRPEQEAADRLLAAIAALSDARWDETKAALVQVASGITLPVMQKILPYVNGKIREAQPDAKLVTAISRSSPGIALYMGRLNDDVWLIWEISVLPVSTQDVAAPSAVAQSAVASFSPATPVKTFLRRALASIARLW